MREFCFRTVLESTATDPAAESGQRQIRADARRNMGIGVLRDVAALRLTGRDRQKFLHGQCTQDINSRKPGEGGYAFMLEPKGRVITDFRFAIFADAIILLMPTRTVEAGEAWLKKFGMLSSISVDRLAGVEHHLAVSGPMTDTNLRAMGISVPGAEEGCWTMTGSGAASILAVRDETFARSGIHLVIQDTSPSSLDVLATPIQGADVLSAADLLSLRLERGRPLFGVDLDSTVLPAESGQEARAVSYTKGCYCGQEVVARQHFLGKPRRMLRGLRFTEDVSCLGEVRWNGDVLGRVTTAGCLEDPTTFVGLAILKGDDHPPGLKVDVFCSESQRTHRAVVEPLPFRD